MPLSLGEVHIPAVQQDAGKERARASLRRVASETPAKDHRSRPKRLLIGHASALVRLGFGELATCMTDTDLCASAADIEQTIAAAKHHQPDLLVLAADFHAAVVAAAPPSRVLLLSSHPHAGTHSRRGDVCGFSSELEPIESLLKTLRQAIDCIEVRSNACACTRCPLRNSLAPASLPLSEREHEVFELIAVGRTTGGIAERLGISVKTVETYRGNIKQKLGLASSTALAEAALLWRRGMRLPPGTSGAQSRRSSGCV